LDSVEYNIEVVGREMKGAVEELEQATTYQKNTGRRKCIFLLMLICVGLVVSPRSLHLYLLFSLFLALYRTNSSSSASSFSCNRSSSSTNLVLTHRLLHQLLRYRSRRASRSLEGARLRCRGSRWSMEEIRIRGQGVERRRRRSW